MSKQEVGTAVAELESTPPLVIEAPSDDVTTAQLVRLAESGRIDVSTLERLVAMKVAAEEREARRQFFEAFANFKAEVGPIPRTKEGAERAGRNGVATRIKYAPLDVIANHIQGPLDRNGFTYWWDSKLHEDGVMLSVFCKVRHVGGHMEVSEFTFPWRDAAPPKANGVQIAGSARTYGERYSLIQAFGLTTADEDTDGEGGGEPITPEQEATLKALGREVDADLDAFLDIFQVDSIAQIPAARYAEAVGVLEQKRARRA